jgi:hypothetical protein
VQLIPKIFEAELDVFPSSNYALVSIIRVLSLLPAKLVISARFQEWFEANARPGALAAIAESVRVLERTGEEMAALDPAHFRAISERGEFPAPSSAINIERYADDILERVRALLLSPDASLDVLRLLVNCHRQAGYISETRYRQSVPPPRLSPSVK